ncbi:MAG: hypothetical protein KKF58_01755 [Gammaproteobacteria bacterium]|nr:hypothetical protein [Gammaproteobacteria bacterium]
MNKIHLIERVNNLRIISKERNEWASCCWVLTEDSAQKLVGGEIYLHVAQDKPSHFGGRIISYSVCLDGSGSEVGRITFNFIAGMEYKNVKTEKSGWGNEKKFVWDEEPK